MRILLFRGLPSTEYRSVTVSLERREQYIKALEKASVEEEIGDFASFVLSFLLL